MRNAIKILLLLLFVGLLSYIAILYNFVPTGNLSFSPHKIEYDVSISKQSGNIVAEDYNGKTIASGISNLDDASVIQKAFDSITDEGTIYFDDSEYSISMPITSTGKNLIIQGDDTKFNINTGSHKPGFTFSGELIKITPVLHDASEGNNVISLNDTSGVIEGDLITIYNDKLWCPKVYPTLKTGETYTVKDISENHVKLNSNLLRDYTTKFNSEARIYRPINVVIDGCTFLGTGSQEGVRAAKLDFCKNSKVSNCYFDNNGLAAISLNTCYGVDITDNLILNSNLPGYGYGVSIANACTDINVQDNNIQICRHCITSGGSDDYGENMNVYISNNTLRNGISAVIDSHASTINYEVTNNEIYCGSKCAFNDGTAYSLFANNKIYEAYGESAIAKRGQVADTKRKITGNYVECASLIDVDNGNLSELIVSNNNIVSTKTADVILLFNMSIERVTINSNSITSGKSGIFITGGNIANISISDNTIENTQRSGVLIDTADTVLNIYNNTISNASREETGYSAIDLYNVKHAIIYDNKISDSYGQTKYGICEDAECDYNSIYGNRIESMNSGVVFIQGTNSTEENNGIGSS
ncbi:right-handed parallel beta-helix repeat-containing protein [Methanosarcina sp.]|uniref:right-handed parallel beta-helix repeat-containing protein n=1 Tax=Methanosarcina sp. TaxID=2213 RepID=UPI003C746A42